MISCGSIIIATPNLKDSIFSKSVVLIIKIIDGIKIGLILNRTLDKVVKLKKLKKTHLKYGGPINGPIIAVHHEEKLAENEIMPDLYYSCEYKNIDEIIASKNCLYQLYSGYACWVEGQLESEISNGYWTVMDSSPLKIIYEEDDFIWTYCRYLYNETYLESIGIKHNKQNYFLN